MSRIVTVNVQIVMDAEGVRCPLSLFLIFLSLPLFFLSSPPLVFSGPRGEQKEWSDRAAAEKCLQAETLMRTF